MLTISDATRDQRAPSVTFDGKSFFVAWDDTRLEGQRDIRGARVSTTGTLLDADGLLLASGTLLHRSAAVAAGPWSKVLATYQAFDDGAPNSPASSRAKARVLVTEDCTVGSPDSDGDGKPDCLDSCPTVAATSVDGCPLGGEGGASGAGGASGPGGEPGAGGEAGVGGTAAGNANGAGGEAGASRGPDDSAGGPSGGKGGRDSDPGARGGKSSGASAGRDSFSRGGDRAAGDAGEGGRDGHAKDSGGSKSKSTIVRTHACGCRVPQSSSSSDGIWLPLALAGLVRRRRTRTCGRTASCS
jgi:MYXO-CTERM domain-containing protein